MPQGRSRPRGGVPDSRRATPYCRRRRAVGKRALCRRVGGARGRPTNSLSVHRSAGGDAGCSRVVRQDGNFSKRAQDAGKTWRGQVADRDPDTIKQEIDQAREQLAATVDSLAARANPRRLAEDVKVQVITFVKKPVVAVSLVSIGALTVVLVVRRFRNR